MNKDRYCSLIFVLLITTITTYSWCRSLSGIVKGAVELKRYCRYYNTNMQSRYPQWFQKEQARKTIAANLQYFLINQSTKDIAQLAIANKISPFEYGRITNSLVNQSCSANLTMIRPRDIAKKFVNIFDELKSSHSLGDNHKVFFNSLNSREKLGVAINRFKQICSWDGKIDNYRMLSWYLSDHFIYSDIITELVESKKAVLCKKDYCHILDKDLFSNEYPLAAGSLNWEEDFKTQYCTHFRFQTHDQRQQPQIIQKWMNEYFSNRTIYLSNLLSHRAEEVLDIKGDGTLSWDDLFTNYAELINNSWKEKAKKSLESKVGYFAHEEPLLLIPIEPRNSYRSRVIDKKLNLDIMVTAGEIDKGLKTYNKISMQLQVKFPSSFFHWVKKSFTYTTIDQKIEHSNLRKKLRDYYKKALESEYQHLVKGPWKKQLPEVLVDETVKILLTSQFSSQNISTSNEWKYVNIKLHFGLFALKHLYEMGPVSGLESEGIKFKQEKFAL